MVALLLALILYMYKHSNPEPLQVLG